MLEATGLQLPLGATCIIERQEGTQLREVESEVVGFNGQKLFLMPLEEVEGILPGARVYARSGVAKGYRAANSCRSARNCLAACWTARASRLMVCPP